MFLRRLTMALSALIGGCGVGYSIAGYVGAALGGATGALSGWLASAKL